MSAATVASLAVFFDTPLSAPASKPTPTHVGVVPPSEQPSEKDAEETPLSAAPSTIASEPDSIALEDSQDVTPATRKDTKEVEATDNTSQTTETEPFEVAQHRLRDAVSVANQEGSSSTPETSGASSSVDAMQEKISLFSPVSAKPLVTPKAKHGSVSPSQPTPVQRGQLNLSSASSSDSSEGLPAKLVIDEDRAAPAPRAGNGTHSKRTETTSTEGKTKRRQLASFSSESPPDPTPTARFRQGTRGYARRPSKSRKTSL